MSMYRKLVLSFCLILLYSIAMFAAQGYGSTGPAGAGDPDAKMATGMSILGNNEAPMSLFIVPWKSSELGVETSLKRTLNERAVPVDRDVFLRELAFHQASVGSKTPAPAAASRTLN